MCTTLQTCMQAFLPPKSSSDNGNCTDLDLSSFKSCWAAHTFAQQAQGLMLRNKKDSPAAALLLHIALPTFPLLLLSLLPNVYSLNDVLACNRQAQKSSAF